jgi:hypothetical protein
MMPEQKRGYKLGRVCPCGSPVSDQAKNGICKPCFVRKMIADPARGAKVSASPKRHLADPANFAAHKARCVRAGRTKSRNLEWCEQAAKTMREKVQPLSMTPEVLARRDYSITGRNSGLSKLSWCAPEFLDDYRALTNGNARTRMKAADARAVIEARMADTAAVRSGAMVEAVYFLNRYTTVKKLDDGTYRYGTTILRAGEVMKRALAKGFVPAFRNQWIDRLAA